MKKIRRIICLALVACAVLACLSGCGSKKEETKTLRFLDVSPSPQRQEYFEEVFAAFEEQTGIKVSYESVSWDDAANKITVLGAAGELPDVFTTVEAWTAQLVESDWVISLDDYVAEHGDEYVAFCQDALWEMHRHTYGHVYTIPAGCTTKVIYYRKDWVEELGYEIPTGSDWTYDAYFDLVEALTDPSKQRYGTSFRGARGGFDPILVYMETFTDGYSYDPEGNSIINTPQSVEAFTRWCDMYKNGCAPKDAVNWGFVEMVDNFTGGLTGTLINDAEVMATCFANMEDDQWGVLPMPVSENGLRLNVAGCAYGYTISSQSTNQEEALALVDFIAQPENNIKYCKMTGDIPVRREVQDDPLYGKDGPYGPFVEQLDDPNLCIPDGLGPFNSTDLQQDMLVTELQRYLMGEKTAQEVCDTIANELTSRMKQYLADNEGATVGSPVYLK